MLRESLDGEPIFAVGDEDVDAERWSEEDDDDNDDDNIAVKDAEGSSLVRDSSERKGLGTAKEAKG